MNKWFGRLFLLLAVLYGGYIGYWDACITVDLDCTLNESLIYTLLAPFMVAVWVLWEKWRDDDE